MNGELVETLTQEERILEQSYVRKINDAISNSYAVIAETLIAVKEQQLWREYSSFNDWALHYFGFSERNLDYYLIAHPITERLKLVDPNADPNLRQTIGLNKFDKENQADIWMATIEAAGRDGVTEAGILEVGERMINEGRAKMRDGVRSIKPSTNASFMSRAKKAWFDLEDDEKAELFNSWCKNESPSFLLVLKSFLEQYTT